MKKIALFVLLLNLIFNQFSFGSGIFFHSNSHVVLCAITLIAGVIIYFEASAFQKNAKVTTGIVEGLFQQEEEQNSK